ncbi:hypothetical protein [Gordonia sp. 4N]|uniref:hypothetical protein n=1 Tax=Gordonia sp. 4N TaxID=2993508 RepID=UPI002248CC55|nr:hypothetical protein [Gordonia sp. 4N]MCX2755515.1 hypothetical protein [Gordonia sp. 4N]
MPTFVTGTDLDYNLVFPDDDPAVVQRYFRHLIENGIVLSTMAGPFEDQDGWSGGAIINLGVVGTLTFSSNVPPLDELADDDDPDRKSLLQVSIPDDLRDEFS